MTAADKSLSRGGTEMVVYSNAIPGIYYIGVKSQDQKAAEYAIMGVFSQLPFGTRDTNGDQHLIGIPTPAPIPDGYVDARINPALAPAIAIMRPADHGAPGDRDQYHRPSN